MTKGTTFIVSACQLSRVVAPNRIASRDLGDGPASDLPIGGSERVTGAPPQKSRLYRHGGDAQISFTPSLCGGLSSYLNFL